LIRRRTFLKAIGGTTVLLACNEKEQPSGPPPVPDARLDSRPSGSPLLLATGETRLTVAGTWLVAYLPASAAALTSIPMFVFLHGGNGNLEPFITAFKPFCDTAGVMLLAPYAANTTWDGIYGPIERDRDGIDTALLWVFNRVPVDPARITMSGFSDGGTYAIAMGLANGDLFKRLAIFAPGFLLPVVSVGRPPIMVAHGNTDAVLSFSNTRDVIVPELASRGHAVDFREFTGGHAVPLGIAQEQFELISELSA
jgi:phospholipase/carboxylesterase